MTAFGERIVTFPSGDPDADEVASILYGFPIVAHEAFCSEMLAQRNLELSGGASQDELVERVIASLKPVGFIGSRQRDAMRSAAERAADGGCAVRFHTDGGEPAGWFVSVAQRGRVDERLDIDALIADYRAYCANAPEVGDAIAGELGRVRYRGLP
jgi:hypothetical protein